MSKLHAGEIRPEAPVFYSARDPNRAEMKHFFAQTGWILVAAGVGVEFCLGVALAWNLLTD